METARRDLCPTRNVGQEAVDEGVREGGGRDQRRIVRVGAEIAADQKGRSAAFRGLPSRRHKSREAYGIGS